MRTVKSARAGSSDGGSYESLKRRSPQCARRISRRNRLTPLSEPAPDDLVGSLCLDEKKSHADFFQFATQFIPMATTSERGIQNDAAALAGSLWPPCGTSSRYVLSVMFFRVEPLLSCRLERPSGDVGTPANLLPQDIRREDGPAELSSQHRASVLLPEAMRPMTMRTIGSDPQTAYCRACLKYRLALSPDGVP